MAKPRIPNQKKQYQLLNRRLAAYMAAVRRIYGELNSEAARIALSTGYDGKQPFAWKDYPATKARVRKLQERFVSQLGGLIMTGTSDEWKRSNLQQDLIVDKVLKAYHTSREDAANERYYRDNSEALQAFQQRKEHGMNLSDKLWDQSQAYREELQDTISAAIERGTDAITLSKQISKYLSDFPAMQRDYKEKYGKASKVQNCEYRSIRLARSEINMAYRSAEQQRWRQLDFVVGYEIKMSGSHPVHDVCDELAGKYPKDFVWNGWHPNCMCYEIPILKTEDEFYGESDKVEPEVKGKVDAEMVEEKLDVKKTMFETHDVFKYELHPEDRAAVESFADRLGRFNPKGEVMSFGIDDVVQTQKYVGTQNVIQIAQSIEKDGLQDNPTGIKVGDKVFIVDGHNRIAAMRLGGSNTFDIRVVEVSEEEWKSAGGQVPEGGFISSKRLGSASINEVTDVPREFKDWVQNNIQRAKSWSTAPYFIQDNTQYVSEEFKVGVYTDEERKFVRKGRTALAMSHIEYLHQLHPEIREVELAAINAYTQPVGPTNRNATSREINRRLRNETEDSYVDIASELISRGIAQLPRVTGEVYRGETMSEAKLKSLYLDNVGQTIRIKSFVSTSTDMDVAEQFISHDGVRKSHKRIILHIYSKNGREIFDISEFNGIFADKNQHECLFDKGTVFYVSPDIEEVNGVIHIKLNEV